MKASGATAGADFARATVRAKAAARPDLPADLTLISLPGGEFLMGSDDGEGEPADGEGPARPVRLSTFRIARTAVTNRQFAAFVEATGYVTYAEEVGSSFDAPWWRETPGACWSRPEGIGSDWRGRGEHPVVHVSWHDAIAFCDWAGLRLPTEAQWEYAARGGLQGRRFPWGDELTPGGEHVCNVWQGRFPALNDGVDGFTGTAPADAFPPNGYGLHNVVGNVWEWCADGFSASHPAGLQLDPIGPETSERRVIRGGSYLCHESYCFRFRVAARSANMPEATAGHMGFRCAADARPDDIPTDLSRKETA